MRITQELLHNFGKQSVEARRRSEPDLLAAYLTGSLLDEDPLLGGTTDIDLVLIHKYQIPVERETEAVTAEVSLDIFHKLKDDYDQHRTLRHNPWMGYPLTRSQILLFDTGHWLEFIQAGVAADFHRSDNVLVRVTGLAEAARESWFGLQSTSEVSHQEWLDLYLSVLKLAANSVAGLIGPPLTTRRFLSSFSRRMEALGTPKILAGFYGLLGVSEFTGDHINDWIDAFELDLHALVETAPYPVHLAPCRHAYYTAAIRDLSLGETPEQAIWPLLRTWLDVQLATTHPLPGAPVWEELLQTTRLVEDNREEKIAALDAYLDNIEIVIEAWAENYG